MTRSIRLLPILAVLAIAACNTVQGAGEDLSTAGQAISTEAQRAQN